MDWADKLNKAMNYIEVNLCNEIDYNEISKIILCPISIMQSVFMLNTGITLTEYIRRRRLSKAAYELKYTNAKVIDVALKYGYLSPDAFYVAFKRFYGITPSAIKHSNIKLKPSYRISFTFSTTYIRTDIKEEITMKILSNVVSVGCFDEGPQIFKYPSCFGSLVAYIDGQNDLKYQLYQYKLALVSSGIAFGTAWSDDMCLESSAMDLAINDDEMIKYSMGCAGYSYKLYDSSTFSEDIIWENIKNSINNNIPVLADYVVGEGWCLLTGYEEIGKKVIGYHAACHDKHWGEGNPMPDAFIDNRGERDAITFVKSHWYDTIKKIVVVDDISVKKIKWDELFTYFINVINRKSLNDNVYLGYDALTKAIEYLNEDNNFLGLLQSEMWQKFYYYHAFIGMHAEAAYYAKDAFDSLFCINFNISDQTLINRIAQIGKHFIQIHNEAFKAWTVMKPEQCWFAENDNSVFTLEKPEVRQNIINSFQQFIRIYKQLVDDFKTFL